MSRADDLRAELALLAMEEEFVALKESGELTRGQKDALRETRQQFRLQRAGATAASPEPIQTATGVADLEG